MRRHWPFRVVTALLPHQLPLSSSLFFRAPSSLSSLFPKILSSSSRACGLFVPWLFPSSHFSSLCLHTHARTHTQTIVCFCCHSHLKLISHLLPTHIYSSRAGGPQQDSGFLHDALELLNCFFKGFFHPTHHLGLTLDCVTSLHFDDLNRQREGWLCTYVHPWTGVSHNAKHISGKVWILYTSLFRFTGTTWL